MNAKRLLKLAERLKTVKPEHFDMTLWARRGFEKQTCGTSACAAGWACTIPSFKRAGLKLDYVSDVADANGTPTLRTETEYFDGMQALEIFFGLSWLEAEHIFGPDHKRTPKEEAKLIAKFVKTGKVPAAPVATVVS